MFRWIDRFQAGHLVIAIDAAAHIPCWGMQFDRLQVDRLLA